MEKISFRIATREDAPIILNFIKGIAEYEKLSDEVITTNEDLIEALFNRKIGKVIFLLLDNKEIGFALYFYNFSTFTGKIGIHLEDFFIYEEYRNRGYGKLLFKEVVKVAKEENCYRLEWACLKWNVPSLGFYHSLNAKELDEWTYFRLTIDQYDDVLKK